MKNSKFKTQSAAMLLVLVMLTIIPNMKVYSAMGNYATTSTTLEANESYISSIEAPEEAEWLTGTAEAIALAYGAGYVLGTVAHHVYNAVTGGEEEEEDSIANLQAMNMPAYDVHDFSSFDN